MGVNFPLYQNVTTVMQMENQWKIGMHIYKILLHYTRGRIILKALRYVLLTVTVADFHHTGTLSTNSINAQANL